MRRLAACLLFVFSIVLNSSTAVAASFALLTSSDEGSTREFSSSLKTSLTSSTWQLSWEGTLQEFGNTPPRQTDLMITLGTQAFQAALSRVDGPPILAVLITRNAFEQAKREAPPHRNGVTAIFLDQPIQRQIALARLLFPNLERLATLLSPATQDLAEPIRRAATAANFRPDLQVLTTPDALLPALERQLALGNSVFLALADSQIYSRDNVRPFLLTTYRYQAPVIAFSPAFVKAGALAAVYSTPAHMGQETAQRLNRLPWPLLAGSLPAPQMPSLFSVSTNPQVARSLGINLASDSDLTQSLSHSGGDRP